MPAKAKLTDAQVKKIRRQVRAGARQTELAVEYGVDPKTIRRRLNALEWAAAERAGRAERRRLQRLQRGAGRRRLEASKPARFALPMPHRAPRSATMAGPRPRRPCAGARPMAAWSGASRSSRTPIGWTSATPAGPPAPPDQRLRLVTASGKTVGRTSASNAEHMSATLEPQYGPLTLLPA